MQLVVTGCRTEQVKLTARCSRNTHRILGSIITEYRHILTHSHWICHITFYSFLFSRSIVFIRCYCFYSCVNSCIVGIVYEIFVGIVICCWWSLALPFFSLSFDVSMFIFCFIRNVPVSLWHNLLLYLFLTFNLIIAGAFLFKFFQRVFVIRSLNLTMKFVCVGFFCRLKKANEIKQFYSFLFKLLFKFAVQYTLQHWAQFTITAACCYFFLAFLILIFNSVSSHAGNIQRIQINQ